jgi:AcrR family transcriptional regulator
MESWAMEKIKTEDARTRLQNAAVALFAEQGYDRTTAAGIAARAGVTERTFFRHFPDKREVLFDGGAVLSAALAESLAGMPAGIAPLAMLFRAFHGVLPLLEANRAVSKPRHDVIANTPALREREVAKHEAMAVALAGALQSRGVAELRAELAARAGMAAFVQATLAWLNDESVTLTAHLDLAQRALEAVLTGVGSGGPQPGK